MKGIVMMRCGRIACAGVMMLMMVAGGCSYKAGDDVGVADDGGLKKLVVGYQLIPNALIVAKDFGWVEEELGIAVEWIVFDSGTDANVAAHTETVDVAVSGSCPAALAVANGLKLVIPYLFDVIGDNEALVVREGEGMQSMQSLRGKKVGVSFGSTAHCHLIAALKLSMIDPGLVELLNMPSADIVAGWKRGDLDAAFVWEPTLQQLLEDGGRVLV